MSFGFVSITPANEIVGDVQCLRNMRQQIQEAHEFWRIHPVKMTSVEKSTIHLEAVLAILNNISISPSQKYSAKVKSIQTGKKEPVNVPHFVAQLDEMYYNQLSHYMLELIKACQHDSDTLNLYHQAHSLIKWTVGSALLGGVLFFLGGAAVSRSPKDSLLGRNVKVGIGGAVGSLTALFFTHGLSQKHIAKNGSAHRIRWIHVVDALEKQRLENFRVIIQAQLFEATLSPFFHMENLTVNDVKKAFTQGNETLTLTQYVFEAIFPQEKYALGELIHPLFKQHYAQIEQQIVENAQNQNALSELNNNKDITKKVFEALYPEDKINEEKQN